MTFAEAVTSCFRRYFRFNGRAIRSEFWWFLLFNILASIAALVVDVGIDVSTKNLGQPIPVFPVSNLASLALIIPTLAVTFRRLHDINHTGWWLLAAIVPIAGLVILLVWLGRKGTDRENRFGPNPLAPDSSVFL